MTLTSAGVDMDVDVDKARGDIVAGDIDSLESIFCFQMFRHRNDFAVFDAYVHDAIDSVDLDSGNLILHIPIVTYKQRGTLPDFTLTARFNAPLWYIVNDVEPVYNPSWNISQPSQDIMSQSTQNFPGWNFAGKGVQVIRGESLALGTYDYQYLNTNNEPDDYTVGYIQDSGGAQHYVYSDSVSGQARTMDGSGIASTGSIAGGLSNLIDSVGVYHTGAPDYWDDGFFDALSDPFGNAITPVTANYTYNPYNYPYTQVDHWVDSLGRIIPAPPGGNLPPGLFAPGCSTYQYPSTSASTAPYTFCYASVRVSSAFGVGNISEFSQIPYTFLSSIQLPNGTSYSFTYNTWGELSQVTLPSGGTISYTWQNVGSPTGSSVSIRTRTLDPRDGTPARTWTYCSLNLPGCNLPINTHSVVDPDGNETWYNFLNLAGTKVTTQYQGSASHGIVLKSTANTYCNGQTVFWQTPALEPGQLCQSVTTLSDGETFASITTYDSPRPVSDPNTLQMCCTTVNSHSYPGYKSIGIPVSQAVTNLGFGATGSTLKTTTTNYLWQTTPSYLLANFL